MKKKEKDGDNKMFHIMNVMDHTTMMMNDIVNYNDFIHYIHC